MFMYVKQNNYPLSSKNRIVLEYLSLNTYILYMLFIQLLLAMFKFISISAHDE